MIGDGRLPARFWAKVREDEAGCWIWAAAKDPDGYGRFQAVYRRSVAAHRHSYLALVGPIPDGLQLDHLCRVVACVNPAHLEPVTNLENARRRKLAYTHCLRGHPLSGENVRMRAGRRHCCECGRQSVRNRRARLRAERAA